MNTKPAKFPTSPADKTRAIAGCTCFKLRGVARRVTQSYDRFMHESGLKITQFSLLGNLRYGDALSVSALAEKMAMDRTTLTRNLKPLEQAGLVAVIDGPDRRTRIVVITAAGKNAFRQAVPYWKKAQQNLVETLGEEMVLRLHALLDESIVKVGGG